MVAVVDPKKHETILDPACGTAGFLISSYKHILAASTDKKGNSKLTPDEKGRLAKNFKGYDISPDMVRLSLVNLYLHGFTDPHIDEYDTLTSEDKWNEFADVSFANPPFMSPKGGIKPHKRFSVQSKRSEVLFVDYIAEHLTPGGRAGIIVPEGIIFQSQTAYTELRRMLVETSLVAVVSLPAGVFNPYSGVKTSILLLDKSLAKQSDTIAFFKIENDGFGLGAQRRATAGSDLPHVRTELAEYFRRLRARESVEDFQPMHGLIVAKEKIAANGDYNLSGERYQTAAVGHTRFPMVSLGEVAEFIRGITFAKSDQLESPTEDSLLVATTKAAQESGIVEEDLYHILRSCLKDDDKLLRTGDILISTANSLNLLGRTTHVKHVDRPISFGAFMSVIRPNGRVLDQYLIRLLRTKFAFDFFVRNANTTTNISNLNLSTLAQFEIPLPPLEVQQEIVAEIEGYQKVIDGARAVLDHYRPHIPIHPDWPTIELREICTFKNGLNFTKDSSGHTVKIIGVSDFQTNLYAPLADLDEVHLDAPLGADYLVKAGDILFVRSNGNPDLVGRSVIVPQTSEPTTFSGFTIRGRIEDERAFPLFYAHFFKSRDFANMIKTVGQGASIRNLSQGILNELKIPLPPLATQQQIVSEIEAEQRLVAANRELIERFEQKIAATLARIWGEEQSAPQEP